MSRELPEYTITHLSEAPAKKFAVGIPVLNEGEKIKTQLTKMYHLKLHEKYDIILFDGNSTDGSMDSDFLTSVGVHTLLIKTSAGRQGTQFRMGFDYILNKGYEGVVTIDGNNKDSVENIPDFVEKLEHGFDFIQGSRFIEGGMAINTPLSRYIAVRCIHAPWISILSRFKFTDTTSAFRGISKTVLKDENLNLFRDIFNAYELLFYMSAKVPRLGYNTIEIPVTRAYPPKGKTPTKISFLGNFKIIMELLKITFNRY